MDPAVTPALSAVFVGDGGPRPTPSTSVRAGLADLREVWILDAGDLDSARERRARASARADVEARRTSGTSASTGDDHLHVGHDRPAQGLRHHPRQPAVRGPQRAAPRPTCTELVFNERSRTLLFIPVAHILARVIQLAAVRARVHLAHSSDVKNAAALLVEFEPTVVLAVPYIFEKIYNTAKHKARQRAARAGSSTGPTRRPSPTARRLDSGGAGVLTGLQHAVFDASSTASCGRRSAGDTDYIVSGGAALGARLGHFFRGVGINPLEGYGLTETCAGVTLNLPGRQRIGSVGRPLPGVSVRIADDGEVQLKGGQVFAGLLEERRGDAQRRSTTRAGSSRVTWASSTTRATCASPAARRTSSSPPAARTSHRPCSRTGCGPTGCSARRRRGRRVDPSSRALITLDPETLPLWLREKGHPERRVGRDDPRGPDAAGRDPGRRRRRQPGGVQGRGDQEVPHPARPADRRGWSADARP